MESIGYACRGGGTWTDAKSCMDELKNSLVLETDKPTDPKFTFTSMTFKERAISCGGRSQEAAIQKRGGGTRP